MAAHAWICAQVMALMIAAHFRPGKGVLEELNGTTLAGTAQYSIVDGKLVADFGYSELTVPPSIDVNVQKLKLNNNLLTFFSFNETMTLLETLNLKKNSLEEFPDLRPASELQNVDMSRNHISFVNPLHFAGLTKLKTLELDSNQLISFPDLSIPWSGKGKLQLAHNEITQIPATRARDLRMDSTNVTHVSVRNLQDCPNLANLSLLKTPVAHVDNLCTAEGADNITSGINIEIGHESMLCNCGLAWMKLWTSGTIDHKCDGQSVQSRKMSFVDFNCKGSDGNTLWTEVDFTKFFCTIPKVVEQLHTANERVCSLHCLSRPSCVIFGWIPPGSSESRVQCLLTGDVVKHRYSATDIYPDARWLIASLILA